jgi:hypothetical protein
MKAVPFIPLAYIAGTHGFALFAPYVAIFVAWLLFTRWRTTNFQQISTI